MPTHYTCIVEDFMKLTPGYQLIYTETVDENIRFYSLRTHSLFPSTPQPKESLLAGPFIHVCKEAAHP